MGSPHPKRHKNGSPKDSAANGFLTGVQLYVADHLHNRKARLRIWERHLTQHGATIVPKPSAAATHVVVESGSVDAGPLPQELQGAKAVTPEWVTDSLAARQQQPEAQYEPQAKPAASEDEALSDGGMSDAEVKYGKWLGHWNAAQLDEANQLTLMMHATYSVYRCREIGNEIICRALNELYKYEMAVDSDRPDDDRHHEHVNYRALGYSRGAAAVMACSFQLDSTLRSMELPYVGASLAKKVVQIAATGTCEQLEQFRNDQLVTTYSGDVRQGSEGGRTRATFIKLPGVGVKMALRWWQAGLRSFEDAEAAVAAGGQFHGRWKDISKEAHFSLMHREELLEKVPPEDVEEMQTAVAAALEASAGRGWRLVPVGGGARGMRSHDVDFIVTHDDRAAEGIVKDVVAELLKQGRLWPGMAQGGEAMLRVQTGRMPGHLDRIKAHVAEDVRAAKLRAEAAGAGRKPRVKEGQGASNLVADRYDHLFGMFKTAAGKARRLDLIFVSAVQIPFGYLGWVGSRQFLRFMRSYANELHMHLNAHALVTKTEHPYLVPDEGPPLNRKGMPEWPPGWDEKRRVQQESDIFELLRIPYHPPQERNCP